MKKNLLLFLIPFSFACTKKDIACKITESITIVSDNGPYNDQMKYPKTSTDIQVITYSKIKGSEIKQLESEGNYTITSSDVDLYNNLFVTITTDKSVKTECE